MAILKQANKGKGKKSKATLAAEAEELRLVEIAKNTGTRNSFSALNPLNFITRGQRAGAEAAPGTSSQEENIPGSSSTSERSFEVIGNEVTDSLEQRIEEMERLVPACAAINAATTTTKFWITKMQLELNSAPVDQLV